MKMNWNFFLAAAFFAGWLLFSNGVPLAPILAGVFIAGAINYKKLTRAHGQK